MIAILAKDQFGQPLAGLTPTWTVLVDAVTGDPLAAPAFTALGSGHYVFNEEELTNPAGIIDLGGLAVPRYAVFQSPSDVKVIAAFDKNNQPLSGLTPTFVSLKKVSDGSDYPQPAITELSDGLYATTWEVEHVTGVIDLGATAFPRYVHYDSEQVSGGGPPVPPVVSNVAPTPGTPIYPDTPLQFDLTNSKGFIVIIPMVILDPLRAPEPVSRGVDDVDFSFEGLYEQSTRAAIADGYRYTLRRRGGWYATPRLLIWAVDINGNIWTGP